MKNLRRGADTKREVKELLQRDLPTIYNLALDLAKNPELAPSARAKLISDLFRAGGLYENDDDGRAKEPHEMTADEIERAIEDLRRQTADRHSGGGIFD